MADPTREEVALANAKARCFATCGKLAEDVSAEQAAAVHAEHSNELGWAYAAFQRAGGELRASNEASGDTEVEAQLHVESGLN